MKILKKISYIILLGLLLITGCKKDFLDVKPLALSTEVSFYTTQQSIDQAITASYGQLLSFELMDIYYIIAYGDVGSDDSEVGGNSFSGDQPPVQAIDRMLHIPLPADGNSRYPQLYGYMYKGIRMANTALHYIPIVKATDKTASVDVLNRLTGEAYFLKAFYTFTLAQIYGGVVLTDDYAVDYTSAPRATLKQTYDFIEKYFTAAIPLLKERSEMGGDNVGRATKSGAKSYLVKALVYESSYAKNYPSDARFAGMQQKWAQALTMAQEIIGSGVYELHGSLSSDRYNSWWASPPLTTTGTIGGYRHLFTIEGDNSKEMIFETQNVNDNLHWGQTHGNYMTMYTTLKYTYNDYATKSIITTQDGWGWHVPTSYLYNAFGNQDTRETSLNSAAYNPSLDPRCATTIAKDGDSALFKYKNKYLWRKIVCVDPTGQHFGTPTGMYSRKYELSPLEFIDIRLADYNGPMNLRLFRYADLLLLASEAAYWSNDKTSALNYVNEVRHRAEVSGNTGYPQPLATLSFEDIIHERRLELGMEGHRFFDLVRWNLAYKFINGIQNGQQDPSYAYQVTFVKEKNEFFPIPTDELQVSGNKLVQNEGY